MHRSHLLVVETRSVEKSSLVKLRTSMHMKSKVLRCLMCDLALVDSTLTVNLTRMLSMDSKALCASVVVSKAKEQLVEALGHVSTFVNRGL